MPRPRKYYIVYADGEARQIAHGADEARHIARTIGGAVTHGGKTLQDAEERLTWYNYQAYRPGGHLHHLTKRGA